MLHGAWLKEQVPGASPCLFLWGASPGLPPGAMSAEGLRRELTKLGSEWAHLGLWTETVAFLPATEAADRNLPGCKLTGLYCPPEEALAVFRLLRAPQDSKAALLLDEDFAFWQRICDSLAQMPGGGKLPLEEWTREMPDSACHVVQYRGASWSRYVRPEKMQWLQSFIGAMRGAVVGSALRSSAGQQVFRTYLRLEEAEGQGDPWRLGYWLQPEDDLSLLLSAADIRAFAEDPASYPYHRLPALREQLRRDLRMAAGLCPPVAASLAEEFPTFCWLSHQETERFLSEQAEALRAAGLGVSMPNWWRKNLAGLGVRVRLEEVATGPGFLGARALAGYSLEAALGAQGISVHELEQIVALKTSLILLVGQWCEIEPEKARRALVLLTRHADRKLPLVQLLAVAASGDTELLEPEAPVCLPLLDFTATDALCALFPGLSAVTAAQGGETPPGFCGALRPYQSRGVAWLTLLSGLGLGACLADDMGLGKTIQVIAYLLGKRRRNPQALPALIICPLSVVDNWRREFARFAPGLRVMLHHGAERLSRKRFAEMAGGQSVVLTTYALAHRDNVEFLTVAWGDIILDEAQNIKNPHISQTASILRLSAPCRMALTGTPVENRLRELWSIMQFLNPGYLLPLPEFEQTYSLPIERWRDSDRGRQLQQLIQPFLLRRLKTDKSIAPDLPDKEEMRLYCRLTREQATLYAATLDVMLEQIATASPAMRKALITATLTKLKQICNHPAHFLKDGSALDRRSGKLIRLVEMLTEVKAAGRRALIFTHYTQMGKLLQQHLSKVFEEPVFFLHGSLTKAQRDELVTDFQQSEQAPSFFILSLKAGGVGLNLTRADTVFHYDRWWNPAVEDQATDRVFRIGQSRNVQVYKMIATATLEEKIDDMIEAKKQLADSIIGSGEAWLGELSTADLHALLRLRQQEPVTGTAIPDINTK